MVNRSFRGQHLAVEVFQASLEVQGFLSQFLHCVPPGPTEVLKERLTLQIVLEILRNVNDGFQRRRFLSRQSSLEGRHSELFPEAGVAAEIGCPFCGLFLTGVPSLYNPPPLLCFVPSTGCGKPGPGEQDE